MINPEQAKLREAIIKQAFSPEMVKLRTEMIKRGLKNAKLTTKRFIK
jgi:hypothetical protein